MNYLHDAFISFAWKDLPRARRLHEQLTARGYDTWYAEKSMRAGDDLPKALWMGLEQSRYVFVIHSRHYAGAKWAERELSVSTADEIDSQTTKVVFLAFDDAELPYGMRHKLYVDFRGSKRAALERLIDLLNQSSGMIVSGVKDAMRSAVDINDIRDCAHRLSNLARRRRELPALQAVSDILIRRPENYHVVDSAAWALGDIGVWDISEEFATEIASVVEQCAASDDPRVVDKMAYICGEMVLAAQSEALRFWSVETIIRCAESVEPHINAPFAYTLKRVADKIADICCETVLTGKTARQRKSAMVIITRYAGSDDPHIGAAFQRALKRIGK